MCNYGPPWIFKSLVALEEREMQRKGGAKSMWRKEDGGRFSGAERAYNLFFTGKYWLNISNRKEFMIRFATERGFDPLIPKNWYSITADVLSEIKVQ